MLTEETPTLTETPILMSEDNKTSLIRKLLGLLEFGEVGATAWGLVIGSDNDDSTTSRDRPSGASGENTSSEPVKTGVFADTTGSTDDLSSEENDSHPPGVDNNPSREDEGKSEDIDTSSDAIDAKVQVREFVENIADSWGDSDERLVARKEAASAVLAYAAEKDQAIGRNDATERFLPEYRVIDQSPSLWWKRNIRPVLQEAGTYDSRNNGYVVVPDAVEIDTESDREGEGRDTDPTADNTTPKPEIRAVVEEVADSWRDSDERLVARKEAASAVLAYAVETDEAVDKNHAIERFLPEYDVVGQSPSTWWKRNIRPVLQAVGEYDNSKDRYVVDSDW